MGHGVGTGRRRWAGLCGRHLLQAQVEGPRQPDAAYRYGHAGLLGGYGRGLTYRPSLEGREIEEYGDQGEKRERCGQNRAAPFQVFAHIVS